MRKSLVIVTLFAAMVFAACNKTNESYTTGSVTVTKGLQTMSGSHTPKEAHTALTLQVHSIYGMTDSTTHAQGMHYAEAYNDIYGTYINVDSYSMAMRSHMIDIGAYDSDGIPVGAFSQKLAASLPASDLKNAINDIINSNDTGSTFINYVTYRLSDAQLPDLSADERNIRDGFEGIIGSSYEIMGAAGPVAPRPLSSLTAKEKKQIAEVDATAYAVGFWFGGVLAGEILSSSASANKTSTILGGDWIRP